MAANAVVRAVVEFLPDPRGHRTFFDAVSRTNRELNGMPAVVAAPQSSSWFRSPHRMTGQASAVASGQARVIRGRASELKDQQTSSAPTTTAIFRSRMQRGQR